MADAWIFTSRANTLLDSLAAASVLRSKFDKIHFGYQHDAGWERAHWEEFKGGFDTIHSFPRLPGCRSLRGVPKYYRGLKGVRKSVRNLGIKRDDFILCLTVLTPLGQSLVSEYRNNFKLICSTEKKIADQRGAVDWKDYRHTTGGWHCHHLIEPLLGMERIYNLKHRRPQGADGERLRRYKAELQDIYQAGLVYQTSPKSGDDGDGFFSFAPYPNISSFTSGEDKSAGLKRVLFFGTPYKLLKNLAPDEYVRLLNECFDFLRIHYPSSDYRLIYRPHPFETDEQDALNLDRFETENDKEAAELYMLRHRREIGAVYTVSSTVSRTAMNYGFDSYALWPVFPFADRTREFFSSIMGQVPDEFSITDLAQGPRSYNSPAQAAERFAGYRAALLKSVSAYVEFLKQR